MYRRQFLKSSAALAGGLAAYSVLPGPANAAGGARNLIISTRSIDVNGKAAKVFGLGEAPGKHGLTFGPGEAFRVQLANNASEPTLIHWHGLTPPNEQDGVPDNPMPMLKGGDTRQFDFALTRPGTYWMHAHTLQEQNLLAAPLIVHSKEDVSADEQEVVVLLHDFSFTAAEELLANLTGGKGGMNHGSMDMGDSMDMGSMDMGAMNMDSMSSMDMAGMDLNDIDYDAYLANDRTLDDPEIVKVEKGGRVRLRIINGATSTAFSISTGALQSELVAVDGQPVVPVRGTVFPVTMGQRIDLAVSIPQEGGAFPILAMREGARERTGIVLATPDAAIKKLSSSAEMKAPVLDLALERRLAASAPLAALQPDKTFMVHLTGDMAAYQWRMMGAQNLNARSGERVEIAIMNMSMMAHPMHLHGHHFQVVGIDGERFAGALRDTLLVPPMKTVTIAFDAGTKGRWAFHCHHLYHMASGMMAFMEVA
jgi:FtsP/CotA-like multicopper oxidase with cupredoxin domain